MRKRTLPLILILLLALFSAAAVSAQDVTLEPPIEVTLEPTLPAITLEPTAEVTPPATAEATAAPGVGLTPAPAATTEMQMTPMSDGAYLRFAHFSPDAPAVDIYVDGSLAVRSLTYPGVSQWIALEPGTHSISVSDSGNSMDKAVLGPTDVSVSAGTWQTAAVIGSSGNNSLNAVLIAEDYNDLLPGTAGFTFFNAVEGSPAVNVSRDDVVYFAQIGYPAEMGSGYSSSLRVDAGQFDVSVTAADDPTTTLAERTHLALPENSYVLVALIGTQDDARLFSVVTDAADVAIARGDLPQPGRLLDALSANENLTSFGDALSNGGMSDTLSGTDEYTIFAPANFVVDNDVNAQSALALRSYIVEGKYTSQELIDAGTLTALDGTQLTITTGDNGIYVNGVQLIDVNIPATNGVIHMLSGTWDMGMTTPEANS